MGPMLAVSLLGGVSATVLALALAYYATTVSTRIRTDPDTCGIPVVTSSVDVVGVIALLAATALVLRGPHGGVPALSCTRPRG